MLYLDRIRGIIRPITDHKLLIGAAVATTAAYLDPNLKDLEDSISHLATGVKTSLALGIVEDYLINKPRLAWDKTKPHIRNFAEFLKYNSNLIAFSLGQSAENILGSKTNPFNQAQRSFWENLSFISGAALSKTFIGEMGLFRKPLNKKQKLPEKIWNFPFEHPVYLGGLSSLAITGTALSTSENNLDAVRYLISAPIATMALSISGDLFHSKALRQNYHLARSTWNRLRGDKKAEEESLIELNELADSAIKKRDSSARLARFYRTNEDHKKADQYLNDSLKYDSIPESPELRIDSTITGLRDKFLYRKLFGKRLSPLERLIDEYSSDEEPRISECTEARLREKTGDLETAKAIRRKLIKQALAEGELVPLERSRNPCYKLRSDRLLPNEIILKEGDREDLIEEVQECERRREILEQRSDFGVPKPIGIITRDGRTFYAMEVEAGETLDKKLNTGDSFVEALEACPSLIAMLHSGSSLKYSKPYRDPREYIPNGLRDLDIDDSIIRLIEEGVGSIEPIVNSVPLVMGIDPTLKNIQVADCKTLISLDTAPGRIVSCASELVDFLDYSPNFRNELAKKLFRSQYREIYSRLSGNKIDGSDFNLAYQNARIIRALERFPSLHGIPERRENQLYGLEIASKAINEIKRKFPGVYSSRQEIYRGLSSAITELEAQTWEAAEAA
jgi:hypothetical protein